jgi:hypothetical protein
MLKRVLGFAMSALFAGPLMGAPIGWSVQSDGDDQLYRIDLATGTAVAVGAVGFSDVEGLSFDPISGVLYGIVTYQPTDHYQYGDRRWHGGWSAWRWHH